MSETTPPDRPEQDRVQRLIAMAQEINSEMDELARDSGQQFTRLSRTARVNRLMIWGVIAGGVLDILLTIVMALFGLQLSNLTDRLDTTQTTQRQRALCPLYGVFLDSKSEEGRKRSPDPEKYDHAFEVIEEGYMVLGCDVYLRESGRDKW